MGSASVLVVFLAGNAIARGRDGHDAFRVV